MARRLPRYVDACWVELLVAAQEASGGARGGGGGGDDDAALDGAGVETKDERDHDRDAAADAAVADGAAVVREADFRVTRDAWAAWAADEFAVRGGGAGAAAVTSPW